ncbi:MAG: glycoside hydrolase family 9 protein [Phycisphaeraceae bacterium]
MNFARQLQSKAVSFPRLRGGYRAYLSAVTAALMVASAAGIVAADPVYLNLSDVANRRLEDDAVAGNGEGGWSDEGANDMFIYPPVQHGDVTRNGHHFRLAKPTPERPNTIIMLRGKALPHLPAKVKVAAPNALGKYIYFLQNMSRTPGGIAGDATVARYTIHYADGSSESLVLQAGRHLRHWWTGSWWDNSGADSWPIFMGQSAYSSKWKQYIGVWAMRWVNPHPDKAITGITLASEGLSLPAIFAITIDNEDYHAGEQLKADFKRPADAPIGYFDAKLAKEREQVFEAMGKLKMIQGVRGVEVIAPDLLAVTLDAWVARGPGAGEAQAAAMQLPQTFTISVNGSQATHPRRVGRLSYEHWNGDIGPFKQNVVYWHTYYLELGKPLPAGASCEVSVAGIEAPFNGSAALRFDPGAVVTRAIKVNQVAYSDLAQRRYAYLGWWAADLGPVNYDLFTRFRVINEATGKPVHQGSITLRTDDDKLSGERVYEMDLSPLKAGAYHIAIDGLGRSSRFAVGGEGIADLYRQTNRAYYHQRAGAALTEPYTTFTTALHHHRMTKSGRVAGDDHQGTPEDPVKTFRGGYHDAADFDVFTYHLRATAQTLAAYEMLPKAFGDGDLNIPESGNGVPDVLDEAHWALMAYLDLQHEDGAVPLGRGNAQDAQRDYVRQHGASPPYGILPPTTTSSAEYAAVAAQFARLIKRYDSARAQAYLASAKRAFAWAQANTQSGDQAQRAGKLLRTWAAGELYATTSDAADHQAFKDLYHDGGYKGYHYTYAVNLPTFMGAYVRCNHSDVATDIRDDLRGELTRRAAEIIKKTDEPAYRVGFGARDRGFGWGTLNGGGHYANLLLLAHHLTGEQRFLDAASLNADFQLGCNPLSKTFITRMGDRPPRHPQIAAYLYTGPVKTGDAVPGITIYGLADRKLSWYPQDVPPWRRWRDLGNGGAEVSSEFTITETIGASSMLYGMLYGLSSAR